jgi:hypothetical protein
MHTLVKIGSLPASAADLPVVKLPGFTSDGVTYEAFSFELRFAAPRRHSDNEPDEAFLTRRDGSGARHFRADMQLARALYRTPDKRARFFHCLSLTDLHREAMTLGADETAARYRRTFVEGRLKKRKLRGQDSMKVWIEPEVAHG